MVTTSQAKSRVAYLGNIKIDKDNVLRYLGYRPGVFPQGRVLSLLDEYIENVHQLLEPSYSCVIRNVARVRDSATLIEGPVIFRSEVVARLLKACRKVAVVVVTIGNTLEDMANRLSRDGLVLQASILDAIGSDAVEKAADLAHSRIEKEANREGLATSRRFSPGYCDWDISQQVKVFRSVGPDLATVTLTDTCLMVPRKSISGIIGIGRGEAVRDYNPCHSCDKHDCRGRRSAPGK